MKRLIIAVAAVVMLVSCASDKRMSQSNGYPITPVPFTSVKVTDNFWGQRLRASREVTIPLAFNKCEETGRYQNFVEARQQMDNSATKELNNGVQKFPAVLFASMFGFHKEPLFDVGEAERANMDKAPEINF